MKANHRLCVLVSTAILWSLRLTGESLAQERSVESPYAAARAPHLATCSPDGEFFVVVTAEGRITYGRTSDGATLRTFYQCHPQAVEFSPDGRFVAYKSAESGRNEVYVAAFPPTGAKWQVSQDGGVEPRFSRDGKELFYFDRENRLTSVEIKTSGSAFETGASKVLFQFHGSGPYRRYDVTPDGQRFLVTTELEAEATSLITLVANWPGGARSRWVPQ